METWNYNEIVTFVIRETGWSLEYIRKLPIEELFALVDELSYQKKVDEYNRNYPLGILAAILTSDKQRHKKPSDFIGYPPKRENIGGDDLWKQAKERGIQPPKT